MIAIKFLFALCFCGSFILSAGQQLPRTEIYLFDLNITDNSVTLSNPVNISSQIGYDNQPFFHPTDPILYYSSANQEERTDIKSFNFQTGETIQITNTNEREYSPTVTPDGKFISCIIQRENGEQNLGKYPIDGGQPLILIDDLIVGYHAWVNDSQLVAFVLGQPNSLYLIDLKRNDDYVVARSISRSLHKIPKSKAMSFMQKSGSDLWQIKQLDPATKEVTTIAETMDGRDHDIAWMPDGKILASTDSRIHFFDTVHDRFGWRVVKLPYDFEKVITRLAVNPMGNKIALVVDE
jgi:Tol biopolymer transport system component